MSEENGRSHGNRALITADKPDRRLVSQCGVAVVRRWRPRANGILTDGQLGDEDSGRRIGPLVHTRLVLDGDAEASIAQTLVATVLPSLNRIAI